MNEERLVDFAALLRQNGLRISPGELIDAAGALSLVPMGDRESVRAALQATLVKRADDAATFSRVFDLYFGGLGRLLEGLEDTLARGLDPGEFSLEELQAIGRALSGLGEEAPVASALLEGRLGDVARLLRAAALQVDFSGLASPLQTGFFGRRVLSAMSGGGGGANREIRLIEEALAANGLDSQLIERVSDRLTDALKALEDSARRAADLEYRARDRELLTRESKGAMHRPIGSLSREELVRMREVVLRLGERLKARIVRKRRERRRGQLHVRRTLRRNLHLGGLPAMPVFRRKRPDRPDVVVLCDVSDSVRNVSRLMLQFLHTLQSLYSRVRTFVFVSDLAEITSNLKDTKPEALLDGAMLASVINLSANSNYGRALRDFHADFRGAVTRKTTVIVIGDGRGNYQPAEAWVLGELRRRARRVVWLCPESRNSWGFGDSEMYAYSRHCHAVFPVRTVDELARAAERILD